jgi:tRNA nucleotidyltransferase/poly(A) polymerase
MAKRNYASELIKKINSGNEKPKESTSYFSMNDKNRIEEIEIKKKKLQKERERLILESKKIVRENKEMEAIDLTKELSKYKNIFHLTEKSSKEEINKLIRDELKNIISNKKKNKEDIVKLEIEENLLKTMNHIYNKSKNRNDIKVYIDFVKYVDQISKIQFGRDIYKQNLFKNQALKEINSKISNSNDIHQTFREIFLSLSK